MDKMVPYEGMDASRYGPEFIDLGYDYRNCENAGKFRGVGQAGKIGTRSSESIDAMPPSPRKMKVPRDHCG